MSSTSSPPPVPPAPSPGRPPLLGIRHVALLVPDLGAAEHFWTEIMGYAVEWRPDADNVYLTSGSDNLALHRAPAPESVPAPETETETGSEPRAARTVERRLDHVGLAVPAPGDVDAWAAHLGRHGVALQTTPRGHRDGSRSFYFHAPDGTLIQIIYHRPLAG